MDTKRCNRSPSQGGISRKELDIYAEKVGLSPKNYKNKKLLCNAIIKIDKSPKRKKVIAKPAKVNTKTQTKKGGNVRKFPYTSNELINGKSLNKNSKNIKSYIKLVYPEYVKFLNMYSRETGHYYINPFNFRIENDLVLKKSALNYIVDQEYRLFYDEEDYVFIGLIKLILSDIINSNFCDNKDVDPKDEDLIIYKKDSKKFCFKKEETKKLLKYQINPYTSHPLSKEFVKKLSPNTKYLGDYLAKNCKKSNDKDLVLSKKSSKWLEDFTKGKYMTNNWLYYIDPEIVEEFSHYKSCGPVKLYRGINFGVYNINELETYLPIIEGKEITYKPDRYVSFSKNESIAYLFASKEWVGIILEITANPEDILLDMTTIISGDSSFEFEKEVILKPGTYKVKFHYAQMNMPGNFNKETVEYINNPVNYSNIKKFSAILKPNYEKWKNGCNFLEVEDFRQIFGTVKLRQYRSYYEIGKNFDNIVVGDSFPKRFEFSNGDFIETKAKEMKNILFKDSDDFFDFFKLNLGNILTTKICPKIDTEDIYTKYSIFSSNIDDAEDETEEEIDEEMVEEYEGEEYEGEEYGEEYDEDTLDIKYKHGKK